MAKKSNGPTYGPVVVSINGLEFRDDSVCVCGHWASAHRDRGTTKCEGFRCGCYTFRQLTEGASNSMSPRCPVCNAPVTGKVIRLDESRTSITTWWLHASAQATTKHSATTPIPVVVAHMPYCSPGDCGCGLGDWWKPGDPVKEGAGVVMKVPVIAGADNLPTALQAEPPDAPIIRVIDEDEPIVKQSKKPFNPIKVNEYEVELAQIRAERNKRQRAPRVQGDEHV